MKFRAGDRVRILCNFDGAPIAGKYGTVLGAVVYGRCPVAVDNWTGGHDAGGAAGYSGWNIAVEAMEPMPQSPLEKSVYEYIDRELRR